jgi:sulfur-oxidizing protein SoxX
MQKSFFGLVSIAAVTGSIVFGSVDVKAQEKGAAASQESAIAEGRELSFDRKKGNCLACHVMGDGNLPGNIGPPLIAMKSRFPDKAKLRAQIYDARVSNPHTIMLPFGPHGILTDEEIDKITAYAYTL